MSEKIAEEVAEYLREARLVTGSGVDVDRVAQWCAAKVAAAVKVAREDAEANAKRAEAAEQERDRYKREVMDYEEREAACCPEDVGFEEVIASLRNRAEAAEAEVSRLKALLSSQGPQNAWQAEAHAASLKRPAKPYTPRVVDVCVVKVDRACDSPLMRGDVVTITGEVGVDSLWVRKVGGESWLVGPDKIRPATPAERAAAGLAPEAHAQPQQPQVLKEHLAWIEADAELTAITFHDKYDFEASLAAKDRAVAASIALRAAVARRDGGVR